MKKMPLLYEHLSDCCGCSACASVCPKHAIDFKYNKEGFLYPLIDSEKCIGCFQCESICSFKKDTMEFNREKSKYPRIYAVKHKDNMIIRNSSSGGLFTALSDSFLNDGNSVASCVYCSNCHDVELLIYNDKETRNKARGSKYIQAEMHDSFIKIREWIERNQTKEMLVVGTGCQIAALAGFLEKYNIRNKVLLVDLICHGATSSGLWKEYANKLEQIHNGTIEYITFKDKKIGWKNPRTFVKINGAEISITPFSDWFYKGWSIRESCYKCPYTKISRNSDITIGDFWGIENIRPDFFDPMGVSLAIIQSEKGRKAFDRLKDMIDIVESNEIDCLQPRLVSPAKIPDKRANFWNDMNIKGIDYCSNKYKDNHFIKSLVKHIEKLKRVLKVLAYPFLKY